jgi:hypothetical protein
MGNGSQVLDTGHRGQDPLCLLPCADHYTLKDCVHLRYTHGYARIFLFVLMVQRSGLYLRNLGRAVSNLVDTRFYLFGKMSPNSWNLDHIYVTVKLNIPVLSYFFFSISQNKDRL